MFGGPAKTAEAVEIAFWVWIRVGPWTRGKFWGKGHARGHARRHSAVICANMAEPIEMPFGLWTRWAQVSMYEY